MTATTRVNGDFDNYSSGTLRSVYQLKGFLIAIKDKDAGAVNCTAEDTDTAGEVDQAIALIIKEVQPLMYQFTANSALHVIVDGHAVDATTLRNRIRAMSGAASDGTPPAAATGIGAGSVDVSGTTVTLATAMALS